MIKAGIIGCGKIAQIRHMPEYQENAHVVLAGFFDRDFERASALAKEYGGKAYQTAEDMFADPEIDAVSICVANKAHALYTIEALEAGKHVLCEKPMATTIEDCEAMIKAAEAAGKKLMIDQNQRMVRTHRRAKELLNEGLIGKVITFRTTFGHGGPETWSINPGMASWFFDRKQSGMGAMADLGVHKTDLIQYLLGENVVETTAKVAALEKRDASGNLIGVDDNAMCIYRMKSGILGTMTASWTYYGAEDNSTILYGDKGIMRIFDDPDCSIKVILRNGEEIDYKVDLIQTNDNQTSTGIIDAFVDCILNDTEPEISGQSVLAAMRAVFASIDASEEGRSISIEQNM